MDRQKAENLKLKFPYLLSTTGEKERETEEQRERGRERGSEGGREGRQTSFSGTFHRAPGTELKMAGVRGGSKFKGILKFYPDFAYTCTFLRKEIQKEDDHICHGSLQS